MTKKFYIYPILLAGTFLGSPAVAETTLLGGEFGEGVQSIYYKWEGTDNHKQLITTTDKNEADITVKYGKDKYSEIFKDLSKEVTVEATFPNSNQIPGGPGVCNSPANGQNYDKKLTDALFDGNHFEGSNSINGKHLYLYGGAIFNGDANNLGDISADFTNNRLKGTSTTDNRMRVYGGAIENENVNGVLGTISGDFINNRAESYGSQSSAHGGAIYNYYYSTIKDIKGNFVGNSVIGNYAADGSSYLAAGGGAIYNEFEAKINDITGHFINNTAQTPTKSSFGGAVYNATSASINNITGNFIGNSVHATGSMGYGGAVYNYNNASIADITGDFIRNYAESEKASAMAGAIYNNTSSKLGNIRGNFIGNHTITKSDKKMILLPAVRFITSIILPSKA